MDGAVIGSVALPADAGPLLTDAAADVSVSLGKSPRVGRRGENGSVTALAELRADCGRCVGLCCVVPAFTRSADFAIDKPAGVPCLHLAEDHRCTIHDRLVPSGFPGCVAFDCFGAGQRLTQAGAAGLDGRVSGPAFAVLLALHELLWYARSALGREPASDLDGRLRAELDRVERAAALPPADLAALEVDTLRAVVAPLLRELSAASRAGLGGPGLSGADLAGQDLRGRDLRGADLRGAVLLGADLRGSDLDRADLLGADVRGADVRGTRLASALFVTQRQLGATRGDGSTTIPAELERPPHWTRPREPEVA